MGVSPRRGRSRRWLLAVVVMLGAGLIAAATAQAAPVLVLRADGRAVRAADPFLAAGLPTPAPASTGAGRSALSRAARSSYAGSAARAASDRTVRSELARMERSGTISTADYRRYLAGFNAALAAVARLHGVRATELEAVIENLHAMAAGGWLNPSRLPALFLTLDRNRRWWTTGPLLSSGQRVQFVGSQLVWEYYPGQGIELQELGSFGQIDWMYEAGPRYWPRLRSLLAELIPLGARRGGALVWEYYFSFDGGSPPWTSAMSQGTALQALTQAYEAFHDRHYLALARQALPVFAQAPPLGVGVPAPHGRRYLLYSFAPGAAVINGFLQSLIGLYDYAKVSRDPRAERLFRLGDAEARAELPRYDTGAWSLYQPGVQDTLDYHELVTGFLADLCARTHAAAYCTTAARFRSYLKTPAALRLLTGRLRSGQPADLGFWVSKPARVGVTVLRGAHTDFLTSADFTAGDGSFAMPPLTAIGRYTVRLDATDLAGNYSQVSRAIQVTR